MCNPLGVQFFDRDTETVARELLGKQLICELNGEREVLTITETEAYVGPEDKACHASRGRTERTEVMFGPPGRFYVYLIYGMYHMLNIITREAGYPAGVLIRGAGALDGPGKLTRELNIGMELNGEVVDPASGVWIADKKDVPSHKIIKTPRIGVEYAKEWVDKPLRFLLNDTADIT